MNFSKNKTSKLNWKRISPNNKSTQKLGEKKISQIDLLKIDLKNKKRSSIA